MDKLKECPFCGGSEIEMQGFSQDGQRYFWPQCMQCGSGCKEQTSHEEAEKLWNTRTTPTPPAGQDKERMDSALDILVRYGGVEGSHHRAWVIDQAVRALTGDDYAKVVAEAKAGEDGPETYEWDEGVAP